MAATSRQGEDMTSQERSDYWQSVVEVVSEFRASLAHGPQGQWTREFESGSDAKLYLDLANLLSDFATSDIVRAAFLRPVDSHGLVYQQRWLLELGILTSISAELRQLRYGLRVDNLLKNPLPIMKDWSSEFANLGHSLRGLLEDGLDDDGLASELYALTRSTEKSLENLTATAARRTVEETSDRLDQIVQQATASALTAGQAATNARAAAGVTADSGMAQHFSALGKAEGRAANRFRIATMVTMLGGGGAAALFLVGPSFGWNAFDIASGDYVHLAQRVLLLGGIFSFAGYLSRQAHNHRRIATWASSLAVQLKTFDAYADSFQFPTLSSGLRKDFAARVFGPQPGLQGESKAENGEALLQRAAELVSKITPGDKS